MLITVAIPTYRRPLDVQEAIKSALNQTLLPCEILVHDNSENDESERVVKAIHSDLIKYRRHPDNLGQTGNWNSLLWAAKGDYVKFLNDDDLLEADCLEVMAKSLARPFGIVTCRATYFSPEEPEKAIRQDYASCNGRNFSIPPGQVTELWLDDLLPLRTPSHSLYSARTAQQIGGFGNDYPYARDVFFGLRLAQQAGALFVDEKPLVRYAMHPGQVAKKTSIDIRINDLYAVKRWAHCNSNHQKSARALSRSLAYTAVREIALMVKTGRYKDALHAYHVTQPGIRNSIHALVRLISKELVSGSPYGGISNVADFVT